MTSHPPSAADVLEAFRVCLRDERGVEYQIASQPDVSERTSPEIDYLLRAEGRPDIAAEVTTLWRSGKAGEDDAYWSGWTVRVQELVRGRLPGRFRVTTSIRVTRRTDVRRFANGLVRIVDPRLAELRELGRRGRLIRDKIDGMDVTVSMASESGSDAEFARFEPELDGFPGEVRRVLDTRAPKLRSHKQAGRETWLVVYNTIWPLTSDAEVRNAFRQELGPDHEHIDGIAVVAGTSRTLGRDGSKRWPGSVFAHGWGGVPQSTGS